MNNCVVLEETSVHDEQYKWKIPLDIGNTNVEKTRAIDFYDEIKKTEERALNIYYSTNRNMVNSFRRDKRQT